MKRMVEVRLDNGTTWTFEGKGAIDKHGNLLVNVSDGQTYHFPLVHVLWWAEREVAA